MGIILPSGGAQQEQSGAEQVVRANWHRSTRRRRRRRPPGNLSLGHGQRGPAGQWGRGSSREAEGGHFLSGRHCGTACSGSTGGTKTKNPNEGGAGTVPPGLAALSMNKRMSMGGRGE